MIQAASVQEGKAARSRMPIVIALLTRARIAACRPAQAHAAGAQPRASTAQLQATDRFFIDP